MKAIVNGNNEVLAFAENVASGNDFIECVSGDIPESTETICWDYAYLYTIDENGVVHQRSEAEIQALQDYEDNKMEEIRAQRDKLLQQCDWTQGADAPLTAQQVTDYATYRQELRDLPTNITDVDDVTWPTEPEYD